MTYNSVLSEELWTRCQILLQADFSFLIHCSKSWITLLPQNVRIKQKAL